MIPKIGSTKQFDISDFEDNLFILAKDDIIIVRPIVTSLTPPQYYEIVGTKVKKALERYEVVFVYAMEPEPNLYSLFNIVTRESIYGH